MTSSIQDLLDWLRDGKIVGYENARLLVETLETIEDQFRTAQEGAVGVVPNLDPLRDIAEIGDGAIKKLATIALARFGDPDSLSAINTLLHDSDLPVRQAAVYSVGSLQQKESLRTLLQILENRSENTELRSAAAMALGNLKYSEAIPALIRTLRDSEVCLRRLAANSLGLIGAVPGEDSPVGPLMTLISDEVPEVRGAAAEALGRIGVPVAADAIFRCTNDEHPAVRRKAVFALAHLHDYRALPLIVDILNDRRNSARHIAANSLGTFSDARSIGALSAALKDEDAQVRLAAVQSLQRIGDPRVLNMLRNMSHNENDQTVLQTLEQAIAVLEGKQEAQKKPQPELRKAEEHVAEQGQTGQQVEAQQQPEAEEQAETEQNRPEETPPSAKVDIYAMVEALPAKLECKSEQTDDGMMLSIVLADGSSKDVRVVIGEDDEGEHVVSISSLCGPADSGNYRNALLVNNYLTYGSITIEETKRYEDFVLRETLPAKNASADGLASIVKYIASTANQISRQLKGEQ